MVFYESLLFISVEKTETDRKKFAASKKVFAEKTLNENCNRKNIHKVVAFFLLSEALTIKKDKLSCPSSIYSATFIHHLVSFSFSSTLV